METELEKLEKGNYTDASWSVFEIALKNAQEVLSKVSSQEDLDEALATLNKPADEVCKKIIMHWLNAEAE